MRWLVWGTLAFACACLVRSALLWGAGLRDVPIWFWALLVVIVSASTVFAQKKRRDPTDAGGVWAQCVFVAVPSVLVAYASWRGANSTGPDSGIGVVFAAGWSMLFLAGLAAVLPHAVYVLGRPMANRM
jgi:hypothetical protein